LCVYGVKSTGAMDGNGTLPYLMIFTFSSSVCLTVKWARFSLGTAWGKHTDGIQPETRVDFFKISIYTGTARFRDPLHFDRSAPEHT
jgi:hypothetical protein